MMSNVNVQTANVHTGNWTKDADGEWILLTDHGAVAAVWPEVNSKPARWRATVWGSGTMRDLDDTFTSKKNAQLAVLAIEGQIP